VRIAEVQEARFTAEVLPAQPVTVEAILTTLTPAGPADPIAWSCRAAISGPNGRAARVRLILLEA